MGQEVIDWTCIWLVPDNLKTRPTPPSSASSPAEDFEQVVFDALLEASRGGQNQIRLPHPL